MLSFCVFSTAVVPCNFFKDQDILRSFQKLEKTFKEQFNYCNVDVASVSADIKSYCERYYGTSLPNDAVTTTDDLFIYIRRLPYHNFLNLEILMQLADCSGIEYLCDLLEEYKRIFFDKKLFELFVGKRIREIKVIAADIRSTIKSCRSNTVLKEDITINGLKDFTIEYANQILYLDAGIFIPDCILKGSICIKWLIPLCLADYAYHSACLNTELFSKFKIVSITIGGYQVEPVEGSVGSECNNGCDKASIY